MIRSLLRAIAVLCAITSATPALAAGSIPISLQSNVDVNGRPLAGCLLYVFQVGTVATPQNMFSDFGLTVTLPNPLQCDQYGRVPMFYLADGAVHVRLTDSAGLQVFDYPSMQVVGPSSGGGGGGSSVDPTSVASTGDVKFRPTSETLTGWVRLNGLTIGTVASGATGRANADTQNLYVYLYANCIDLHCPVSGGRTGVALNDFTANKTIGMPDMRGRVFAGLDDMGAALSNRISINNITSGGVDSPAVPMASGGECCHFVSQAELPNVNLTTSGTNLIVAAAQGSHTHASSTIPATSAAAGFGGVGAAANPSTGPNTTIGVTMPAATLPQMTVSGTIPLGGSGTAGNNMPPFALGTWHMKL